MKVLVTGAAGQIGSELVPFLRERYGKENVIASDKRQPAQDESPFEILDVLQKDSITRVVEDNDINVIYHLAAILSATGEKNPQLAYNVNNNGLFNVLEVSREHQLQRVIFPSSIAAFGPDTPKDNTPNETVLRPTTMYGISKVTGELLGNYYFQKYALDTRGIRYPGIISNKTLPGGGTTDYSVEMYHAAVKNEHYTCFLKEDATLPMMYMPDALKAITDLAEADLEKLSHHCDFNVASMSFSPKELEEAIREEIPDFTVDYKPDFRQAIAESWPRSIDDSAARSEWDWKPEYDLPTMTKDMLEALRKTL